MGKWEPKKKEEKKPIIIQFKSIKPKKREIKDHTPTNKGKEIDIDFEKRDKRNRRLGNKSEQIVFEYERNELIKAGREDLLENVVNRSKQPGLGYDIESITPDKQPKIIEVKTEGVNSSFFNVN